jgi:hypothetical protein
MHFLSSELEGLYTLYHVNMAVILAIKMYSTVIGVQLYSSYAENSISENARGLRWLGFNYRGSMFAYLGSIEGQAGAWLLKSGYSTV